MKNRKLWASAAIASTLFVATACQSQYAAEHSFEIGFDEFIDQLAPIVEVASEGEMKAPKVSKFKSVKNVWSYENNELGMKIYLKDDEVSRVEFTISDNRKLTEEDVEELTYLWVSSAFVLQPGLIFDSEFTEEFNDFVSELADSASEERKVTESIDLYDGLHEITYRPNKSLTVSISANGEEAFESDEMSLYLELFKMLGYDNLGEIFDLMNSNFFEELLSFENLDLDLEELMDHTPESALQNQSSTLDTITQKEEVTVKEETKEESASTSKNSTTSLATPSNPAKLGETVPISFKNYTKNEMVEGTITLNKIIRGKEALRRIDEYNEKSTLSTIDYSELDDAISEIMLFEYTLTAPSTDSKSDHYGSVSSDIVANDGESAVKYNGNSYLFSLTKSLNLEYDDLKVGKPATFTYIVEVPKGYDDFLLEFSAYEGEIKAYFTVKQ